MGPIFQIDYQNRTFCLIPIRRTTRVAWDPFSGFRGVPGSILPNKPTRRPIGL